MRWTRQRPSDRRCMRIVDSWGGSLSSTSVLASVLVLIVVVDVPVVLDDVVVVVGVPTLCWWRIDRRWSSPDA